MEVKYLKLLSEPQSKHEKIQLTCVTQSLRKSTFKWVGQYTLRLRALSEALQRMFVLNALYVFCNQITSILRTQKPCKENQTITYTKTMFFVSLYIRVLLSISILIYLHSLILEINEVILSAFYLMDFSRESKNTHFSMTKNGRPPRLP